MNLVMDSSALIALLRKEEGAEVVRSLIDAPASSCFVHAVNLCEIYYGFRRESGEETAQKAIGAILQIGVQLRDDMDPEFWQAAGRYKADLKLPLGDAFLLAAAERTESEVVTADRHELEAVAQEGLATIRFIW